MQEIDAIEVAAHFAAQKGYDVSNYDVTSIKQDERWNICFRRSSATKKPNPGDFFTVCVNDATGVAERIIYGK